MYLEEKKVLKFEIQHWDPYKYCRVAIGFEYLNDLEDKIFMIFVLYEEVEDLACKR